MKFLPRSLFWRLALLLLLVILVSQGAAYFLFRQDRAALIMRQFGDTKIAQIQALREALKGADPNARDDQLARLGAAYEAEIVRTENHAFVGGAPRAAVMVELAQRLQAALGEQTEVRVQPYKQMLWVKLEAGQHAFWAGFRFAPTGDNELPQRLLVWSAFIMALLGLSAWSFARITARPLRNLSQAVNALGQGRTPAPLPETGPAEIAQLARGFNQMTASLQQMEADRVLLLASVSHDLRTPLSRLRLGAEMGVADASMQKGMIEDIEEMDRIIHQFLDFARGEENLTMASCDLNRIVNQTVERYRRDGRRISFAPGDIPQLILRPTSIERVLINLIDNAYKYGSASVDIVTRKAPNEILLDVADRGPGIPPDQVERLKQPFTRLSAARSGAMGSGLGLAIVERVARLHGASFDLLPREGGGTVARLAFPLMPLPV